MSATHTVRLAAMDWPWKEEDPGIGIILVSDQQFLNLAEHPDEAVERMHPQADEPVSLREHCRQGAERGATKLRIAYDYFFGGTTRGLYPDTPEFQQALKKVHAVAQEYGLGLEPSVLSPLELGVGYRARTGEAGRWMHYREGLRNPETGAYAVELWQHLQWCNNKGPTPVKLLGARAFAFRETPVPGTPFYAVAPEELVELATPTIEPDPGNIVRTEVVPGATAQTEAQFRAQRVRVHGTGDTQIGPLDRVLVVLLYETVEMDYLSPNAETFLDELVHEYHARGISLAGIYSDEMHIQQDWSYHDHMDQGQFCVRYVSPGFERAFAARYGAQYADFARYLVYFCCHQHDFAISHAPVLPSQHVMGADVAAIQATLRLRRDYYAFLEGNVVRLMTTALHTAERLNGHALDTYYHATWAESPTCDAWAVGGVHESWSPEEHNRRYEYTPDFIWSNTVHQAAAACANYFQWNEFLCGGNNDTAEGGYADRDYYGRALACSLAALNRRPLANAHAWGMPEPVRARMQAVSAVFGAGGHPSYRSVLDYEPRTIETLFLYPQDLVAVDERFGSWVVQYGYANLITAEKLLEHGRLASDGTLEVNGWRYRAVCALYEPFADAALLALLQRFVEHGGLVVWSGVPPMAAGDATLAASFNALFGVQLQASRDPLGLALPARQVTFAGALATVTPMAIPSDFVVDRVFPAQPETGSEAVAWLRSGGAPTPQCVGVLKRYAGGGQALYLGFRPRDDQAASTGAEVRTWFELLSALGAYPGDDNPTVVSRNSGYLACSFRNGALALCPHYRRHEETWPGPFFRNEELDRHLMDLNPPPDDAITLDAFRLSGQVVSYRGRHAVAWRRDAEGRLCAFAGRECTGLTIDGRSYVWAETPVDVAWHPLAKAQVVPGYRPLYRVWCGSLGQVHLPLGLPSGVDLEVWLGASIPASGRGGIRGRVGYGQRPVPYRVQAGTLVLDVNEELCDHWLYVVQRA